MKNIYFLALLLISCHPTYTNIQAENFTREQVFLNDLDKKSTENRCFAKMMLNGVPTWTQVICELDITPHLITQIQTGLLDHGYTINEKEYKERKFGKTTKEAMIEFQISNNLAYGGIDWATINRLRFKE